VQSASRNVGADLLVLTKYLEENVASADLVLSSDEVTALEAGVSKRDVAGEHYTEDGVKGLNA
jgi:hypothetical protein